MPSIIKMSILNTDVNLCSICKFLAKKTQVLNLFSIFASFKHQAAQRYADNIVFAICKGAELETAATDLMP